MIRPRIPLFFSPCFSPHFRPAGGVARASFAFFLFVLCCALFAAFVLPLSLLCIPLSLLRSQGGPGSFAVPLDLAGGVLDSLLPLLGHPWQGAWWVLARSSSHEGGFLIYPYNRAQTLDILGTLF